MQQGEDGELAIIAQEDYMHSVAVDLINGLIFLEYTRIGYQNGTIEVEFPNNDPRGRIIVICDETLRVGELFHIESSEPDKDGNYFNTFKRLVWRPIWFTRNTIPGPGPVKVIGAQTTLPESYGGGNVKKLISLFPDNTIGIS